MKDLDALKNNWQNMNPAAATYTDPQKLLNSSLSKLKKFEKRIYRINILKTAGMITGMGIIIFSLFSNGAVTPLEAAGVSGIILSTLIFWAEYWRVQLKTGKLDMTASTIKYNGGLTENFKEQRNFFGKKFKIFGALLIIFINVIYIDMLAGTELAERIGIHLAVSLLLTAALHYGLKFRMFRFKREYDPIENELQQIKKDLEGKNENE